MTYPDFAAARLLIAERRYGAPMRAHVREVQAREEAAIEATKAAIRRAEKVA